MRNYDEMSDFEINKSVAEFTHTIKRIDTEGKTVMVGEFQTFGVINYSTFNPCDNALHAMPIIRNNGISIIAPSDCVTDWQARSELSDYLHCAYSDNPLRAAMVAFLMMQESKDA